MLSALRQFAGLLRKSLRTCLYGLGWGLVLGAIFDEGLTGTTETALLYGGWVAIAVYVFGIRPKRIAKPNEGELLIQQVFFFGLNDLLDHQVLVFLVQKEYFSPLNLYQANLYLLH